VCDCCCCLLLLSSGWGLDSAVKYGFAVVGTFLMGVSNELLARSRVKLAQYLSAPRPGASCCAPPGPALIETYPVPCRVALGALHGAQMVLAYWMMLLVMLYETCIFSALVIGLATGYGLFSTSFQTMLGNAQLAHKQATIKKQQQQGKRIQPESTDVDADALLTASLNVEGGGEADKMMIKNANASSAGVDVAASDEDDSLVLQVNAVPGNAPCCGGTA
jgi:hypothetical protein